MNSRKQQNQVPQMRQNHWKIERMHCKQKNLRKDQMNQRNTRKRRKQGKEELFK